MKFSKSFINTTKQAPKDSILASHSYLVRGSFINQVGAGLYDYLPLGKIVLEKIKTIIKNSMDDIGANELQFSFVTPYSLWEESNRSNSMGSELLKFKDRKHTSYVLSPTNEESVVSLVKNNITSYKQLPINLYQINTKFRDEARPRFGIMRGREFLMKDSYSFHCNEDDLNKHFILMEQTYKNIFTKLGLDFKVVEASSGSIGGSGSKEFMVLANCGEDTIVTCNSCEYAANIEAAIRKKRDIDSVLINDKDEKLEKVHTNNIKTIDEVSTFFNISKSNIIKAIIKKAIFTNSKENKIVVFFIRGDDELELTKATNVCNAIDLIDIDSNDILDSNITLGYCGIIDLDKNITFFVDKELENNRNLISGANEENFHYKNIDLSSLDDIKYNDLICVQNGDICSKCGNKLYHTKGIEVGHIFKLGIKYSQSMNATFLDSNGKSKHFIMGCYGIGVSRLLSAIIEQNHDEKGCIWTKYSSPFQIHIIVSNAKDENELNMGMNLYNDLKKDNIEVIIDDRVNFRFGFKIRDYELLGVPYAIIVGKKLKDNILEIVDRKTLNKIEVEVHNIKEKILSLINKN